MFITHILFIQRSLIVHKFLFVLKTLLTLTHKSFFAFIHRLLLTLIHKLLFDLIHRLLLDLIHRLLLNFIHKLLKNLTITHVHLMLIIIHNHSCSHMFIITHSHSHAFTNVHNHSQMFTIIFIITYSCSMLTIIHNHSCSFDVHSYSQSNCSSFFIIICKPPNSFMLPCSHSQTS
jgi:hypothetical protein